MSNPLSIKYRPKKLSEIIGQDHVVRILENSIKNGDLHHAYIFAGNFGCGKTSAARVFAASLNNPGGASLTPSMDSDLIRSIFENKSADVIEIDAASAGSIDGIRELKQTIQYAPIGCKYRFVILDEAHRLSGAAAEAALKMIEEPPDETIFILATTDPQKLKDTIHSRCITLRFNKVGWDRIFSHLKNIADSEGYKYEDGALKVAARRSKGSVRNSLQNLQMMHTYADDKTITAEMALKALSAVDESYYFNLVDAILKPDAGEAMRVITSLLEDGRDVGEVLDGLVGHLRNLLVITTCPSTEGLIFLTEEEKKRYVHQMSKMPEGKAMVLIAHMIDLLHQVARGMHLNINPQTLLEKFTVESISFNAALKKRTA